LDYFPVTLTDVLNGTKSIEEAIYIHPYTGLRIFPASLSLRDIRLISLMKMLRLTDLVKELNYDFVILDSAPGLGFEATSTLKAANEVIIITTPDIPSVTDAAKAIEVIKQMKNKKLLGTVVNKVKKKRYELTIPEIESMCGNIISVIPHDLKIPESISKGIPVNLYDERSRASVQIKKLAAALASEEYTPPGRWRRIWHKIKKPFLKIKPKKFSIEEYYLEKGLKKQ